MILVVNAGSSSIKYTLFDLKGLIVVAKGQVERLGSEEGGFTHEWWEKGKANKEFGLLVKPDHRSAFQFIGSKLKETALPNVEALQAIGHRVVHGGERFSDTTIITEEVKETIRELIPLAPLHNPPNLLGIEISEEVFPQAIQIGVFDTAFHQSFPAHTYRYAVPGKYYHEYGIRKYGFHGTSHRYITETCQAYFNRKEVNLIIAHLGNGASITAVQDGLSMDNSMGMGPLPGLIMGTRSGDIDPSLIFHLVEEYNWSLEQIEKDLNKASGLKGICDFSDLREVEAAAQNGNEEARLALEMYVYRIRHFLGGYLANLKKVDALVFTAGVGENSKSIRRAILQDLNHVGLSIDEAKNENLPEGQVKDISDTASRVKVLVVPTDEEKQIAIEVSQVLGSQS